jgi:hypothetical protein
MNLVEPYGLLLIVLLLAVNFYKTALSRLAHSSIIPYKFLKLKEEFFQYLYQLIGKRLLD